MENTTKGPRKPAEVFRTNPPITSSAFQHSHHSVKSVLLPLLLFCRGFILEKEKQILTRMALSRACTSANATKLKGSVKEPNILIYFFFPPITQLCSVSDVLFTGGRGVSDFNFF